MRKEVEEYLDRANREQIVRQAQERADTLVACGLYTKEYGAFGPEYPEQEGDQSFRKVPMEVTDEEYAAIRATLPKSGQTQKAAEMKHSAIAVALAVLAFIGYGSAFLWALPHFGWMGFFQEAFLSTLMLGVSALLWDSWAHAHKG